MGGKASKALKKVKSKKNLKNESAAAVPAAGGGEASSGAVDNAAAAPTEQAVVAPKTEAAATAASVEQPAAPAAKVDPVTELTAPATTTSIPTSVSADAKHAADTAAASAGSAANVSAVSIKDDAQNNPLTDAANKAAADAYTAAAGTQDHAQASVAAVAAATTAAAGGVEHLSGHDAVHPATLPVGEEVKAQDEHVEGGTTTAQDGEQARDALTANPPAEEVSATTATDVPATTTTELTPTPHRKPKIYVVMYTTWGHTKTLADEIIKGIEAAGGEATLWRVPETLGADVLGKMHANLDAIADVPVITAENLTEADGFLFGLPTRYGTAPTQIKAFWDSTGGLWQVGALVGKYGGLFHTTATQHGGQETTSLTFLAHYVHHGILYVPLGYSCPILNDNTEVLGGSAYGAGTIAGGDGSRQPSAKELQVANWQGKEFAKILAKTV